MTFTHRPYLFLRIFVASLIVGVLFSGYVVIAQARERNARISAVSAQQKQLTDLVNQNRALIEQNKATASTLNIEQRKLVRLSNGIKLKTCAEANLSIKRLIATEYAKDVAQMNRLLPPPRTDEEERVANIFLSEGVRAVKDANPFHDCSATALNLQPLPPLLAPDAGGVEVSGGGTPKATSPSSRAASTATNTTTCRQRGQSPVCRAKQSQPHNP